MIFWIRQNDLDPPQSGYATLHSRLRGPDCSYTDKECSHILYVQSVDKFHLPHLPLRQEQERERERERGDKKLEGPKQVLVPFLYGVQQRPKI